MPGGPWSPAAPPTRPGLYINFISDALEAVSAGVRGRVAMIVHSQTGPVNQAQVIDSFGELVNYFTTSEVAPNNAYYAGRQAFLGGARELRMYRIGGSDTENATSTLNDTTAVTPVAAIRIDAKSNGVYGNGFTYTTRVNPGDATKTDLLLYVAGVLAATYTTNVNRGVAGHIANLAALLNADTNNYWVTATVLAAGNETPATVTGTALAGGDDGTAPVLADYVNLLETVGLDADDWDTFTMDTLDSDIPGIEAIQAAWFANLREDGNRKSMVVGSDLDDSDVEADAAAAALNNEGVQYVYPGVQQVNGAGNLTTYRGAAFAAQIAGVRASLPLGQGMTFSSLADVVGLERRIKGSIVDLHILNGVTVLGKAGLNYNIVSGVTSLVSPGNALDGNPIPVGFKKVSIVNTTDAIAAAIELAARTSYIGKVPNDENGQAAIAGVVRDFLRTMAGQRAIRNNFTAEISAMRPSTGDQLFLDLSMTVVDTIDRILVTVKVGA